MVWFRRTNKELEEAMERAHVLFEPLGARYRFTAKTWQFQNGGWLKFRGLDKPGAERAYQGHSHSLLIFDEIGNFENPDVVDALNATLRSPHGVPTQMIGTANPGGPGHLWVKNRYIEGHQPLQPFYDKEKFTERVFIPSRLQDNLALMRGDPTYENRIRASGPAWLVKAWLEGDWNATLVGKLITMDWFRRYDVAPHRDAFQRVILSVDAANKDKQWDSFSVIQVWGELNGSFYLLDAWEEHVQFGDLETFVKLWAAAWRPNAIVIEDKGNGQPLLQNLRRDDTFSQSVIDAIPTADKVLRMSIESAAIQAGRVWIPRTGTGLGWLPGWESKVALFPTIKDKDHVDAMSQALGYFRAVPLGGGFQVEWVGRDAQPVVPFRFGGGR